MIQSFLFTMPYLYWSLFSQLFSEEVTFLFFKELVFYIYTSFSSSRCQEPGYKDAGQARAWVGQDLKMWSKFSQKGQGQKQQSVPMSCHRIRLESRSKSCTGWVPSESVQLGLVEEARQEVRSREGDQELSLGSETGSKEGYQDYIARSVCSSKPGIHLVAQTASGCFLWALNSECGTIRECSRLHKSGPLWAAHSVVLEPVGLKGFCSLLLQSCQWCGRPTDPHNRISKHFTNIN